MNRRQRVVLISMGCVAIVLLCAIAWLFTSEHRWLEDEIEAAMTTALGREVRIDGGLTVELGRSSVVTVEGFSIAAPGWSDDDELLSIDRAVAVLDTLSIFADTVVLESLEVDGFKVALERDESHGANWDFGFEHDTEAQPEEGKRTTLPFRIADLAVQDGSVRYRTPTLAAPLDVRVNSLLQQMSGDATAALQLEGAVNGTPLDIRVEFADMIALSRLRDVGLSFSGTVGDIDMDGELAVDDLLKPRRPTARLAITGPGGKYLGDLLHIPDLDSGELDVHLAVAPDGDRMRVELDATVARFRMTGNGHFDDLSSLGSAQGALTAEGPNARRFALLFGVDDVPAQPYSLRLQTTVTGRTVDIPEFDAILGETTARGQAYFQDFPRPDGARISLNAAGPAVEDFGGLTGLDDRLRGAFELDLDMSAAQGGGASIDLRLDAAGARLRANGPVRQQGMQLAVSLSADDAESTLRHLQLSGTRIPAAPARLSGQLEFDGDRLDFKKWQASVGDTEASFDAILDGIGEGGTLHIDGKLEGDEVSTWLPLLSEKLGVSGHFEADAKLTFTGTRIDVETFDGRLGGVDLSATGEIDTERVHTGTRLDIRAAIDDISRWSDAVARDLPAESAALHLVLANVDAGINAETFEARLGPSAMTGRLKFLREPEPRIEVSLASDRLDLGRYLPDPGDVAEVSEAAETPADGLVIPDTAVPVFSADSIDVEASVDVAELVLRNSTYRDVRASASRRNGIIKVDRIALIGESGATLSGVAQLVPVDKGARVIMMLEGSAMKFGLPAATPEDFAALPAYDLNLALAAQGATIREMARGVDGYLRVYAVDGKIRAGALSLLSQDFVLQLLQTINPFFREEPYARVECLVAYAVAERGVIRGKPILLARTDKLQVVADAKINFSDESIDADINSIARKGLGISLGDFINPYIKVGGTLASPMLILDPKTALVEGGAAVATGGLSILAKNLYTRFFSGSDPCRKVLNDSREQFESLESGFRERLRQAAQ